MQSIIRGLVIAASLLAPSLAAAQVCPVVSALPDSERRVAYSPSASTGPFAVSFPLLGDSTDYGAWVEVWLNGVMLTPVTAWQLTIPSGTLATACRPITNASVTLTTAATGTLQIVGARRPRRTSQFPENLGVSARSLNQVITDLTAQNRETWDKINDVTGRALIGLPGESITTMPSAANRANKFLGFDATGLIPVMASIANMSGGVTCSVVGAFVVSTGPGSQCSTTAGSNPTVANAGWWRGRNAADSANLNMFRVNTANVTEWSNPLYYDTTSGFIDRGSVLTITRTLANPSPTGIYPSMYVLTLGSGNNGHTTIAGVSNAVFHVGDAPGTTSLTKGTLYGTQFIVSPIVDRNDTPWDDAVAAVFQNGGTAKATELAYFGRNAAIVGNEAEAAIGIATHANVGIYLTGAYAYGITFVHGITATFTQAAIQLPNNEAMVGRNQAGSADISLLKANTANHAEIGAPTRIVTGASNNLTIAQLTGFTTYNTISLNGNNTPTGMIGIAGGASGDSGLYYYVPTGGLHTFRINNADIITLPTAVGTAGQPLLSSGNGSTAATFGTLGAPGGGTGFASYAVGDILYANTTTTLAKLAGVATGNALISGGVNTAPSWGKISNSHLTNSSVIYGTTAVALGASSTVIDGLTRVNLTSGSNINWNSDTYLGRAGAANVMHGQADAASPVAQTLSVQNVVAGTSNVAGALFAITGSRGTGTGLGGDVAVQVSPPGSTGSTQNALLTAFRATTFGTNVTAWFKVEGSASGGYTWVGQNPGATNYAGFWALPSGTTPTATNYLLVTRNDATDPVIYWNASQATGIHQFMVQGSGPFLSISSTVVSSSLGFTVTAAAKTLVLKQGANGTVGTFVCNGATPVTVNNTNVAVTDTIIISLNTVGGTVGAQPSVKTITAATGFTVACTASDTSTMNYAIIKNAAWLMPANDNNPMRNAA